jgi:hypothetical protein
MTRPNLPILCESECFSQWNLVCCPLIMLRVLPFALLASLAYGADIPLLDVTRLELKNSRAEVSRYKGSPAIKLEASAPENGDGWAVIKGTRFHNGTIDLDVAGAPAKGAPEGARGFIGIDFRIQADGGHWENIYVRPTNGRAPDQLRRNHTTQYTSHPDWPWERLRKETPGVYESYVDMIAGEWTHLRMVVRGTDASLYVGGAEQPCLLVHDLKLGDVEGSVALWIGPGTEGYFRNVVISEK